MTTEDYRHVDPQFGGDRALLRLRRKPVQGMRLVLDGVFNHSGDSRNVIGLTGHNRGTGGACHRGLAVARLVLLFHHKALALDWLGYRACRNSIINPETLVVDLSR